MEATRWSPKAPLSAITAGANGGAQLLDLFDDNGSFFEVEITALPRHDNMAVADATSVSPAIDSSHPSVLDESGLALASDTDPDGMEPRATSHGVTKKKSTFQRQKDELAFLLSHIAELEAQLRVLRGTKRPKSAPLDESSEGDRPAEHAAASLSLWHVLAKHQLSERNRADQENAELRKMLNEQTLLARSLERMIRKRSLLLQGHRETRQRCPVETCNKDADIFRVLLNKVEQRAKSVDDVFAAHGLTAAVTDLNLTNVLPNGKQSVHVEFTKAQMLAFDFRALSLTLWKHLRQKELKFEGTKLNMQVIQHSDELLITKQGIPLNSSTSGTSGSTTVFSVFKRIVQENRILLVWDCLVERNGSAARGIPAFYLTHHGCSQTIRGHDKSPGDQPSASLMQSHARLVVPIQIGNSDRSQDQEAASQNIDSAVFIDMITASSQQNAQTFLYLVENALVQDLVTQDAEH